MYIKEINIYLDNKFLGSFYNIDESIITTNGHCFMLMWGDSIPHSAFCIAFVNIERKQISKNKIEYYLTKTV